MRALWVGLMTLFGIVACNDKGDESGHTAPPLDTTIDDSGGEDCSGTPPVAEIQSCSYPGAQEHEEYKEPVPVIKFEVKVTDEDGDLNRYRSDIYVDPTADGVIDPDDGDVDYVQGNPSTVDEEACGTSAINLTQSLFLPPGFVSYGEDVDWGVMITDAAGISGEIAVITCASPEADGGEPTGGSGDDSGA